MRMGMQDDRCVDCYIVFKCVTCFAVTVGMAAIVLIPSIICGEERDSFGIPHIATYWTHCLMSSLCAFGWREARLASCIGFSLSQQVIALYQISKASIGDDCFFIISGVYIFSTCCSTLMVGKECDIKLEPKPKTFPGTSSSVCTCSVCGEVFAHDSSVEYACGHRFHIACVRDWLSNQDECVVCATSFGQGNQFYGGDVELQIQEI